MENHTTAKIIQDSLSQGVRLTTFELEYPRFIHAEVLTHRQFSRNSASSRAIPTERMLDLLHEQPALPEYWGRNQPGMTAGEEVERKAEALETWLQARDQAAHFSKQLHSLGLHKQLANRPTEPFQTIKVVVTATEWENWYELRDHQDAQPEIRKLAHLMRQAQDSSQPLHIQQGDWHVPYVDRQVRLGQVFYEIGGEYLSTPEARLISASCCAQVSYRRLDGSKEKALRIAQSLIGGRPWHASPFEHQARPMISHLQPHRWEPGATHQDRRGRFWSGNFRGWIQHRQLLEQAG